MDLYFAVYGPMSSVQHGQSYLTPSFPVSSWIGVLWIQTLAMDFDESIGDAPTMLPGTHQP